MPKRTNSGKGHQEALSFKAQFSGSVIIKIIDIIEAQDCQRCISFMIQTKDRGKKHFSWKTILIVFLRSGPDEFSSENSGIEKRGLVSNCRIRDKRQNGW